MFSRPIKLKKPKDLYSEDKRAGAVHRSGEELSKTARRTLSSETQDIVWSEQFTNIIEKMQPQNWMQWVGSFPMPNVESPAAHRILWSRVILKIGSR
ncbi:hypothetical protein GE061_003292 [Apolygus lucorum]|uniref:Uncharacterized protein n=1 Tax=Apolygus lucorum TaxID=248454 RepID=A0A8S9X5P8_APOLU|nr:hypothetical protein GE061_003292 [Apolygus lucorum]